MKRSAKAVKRVAICVLFALVWSGIVILQEVSATPVFPVGLEQQTVGAVLTNTDSSVTVTNCTQASNDAYAAKTFDADGQVIRTIPVASNVKLDKFCGGTDAVAAGGVTYMPRYDFTAGSVTVVANSTSQLWSRTIPTACGDVDVRDMSLGSDDKLYLLVASSCNAYRLLSINRANGTIAFDESLGTSSMSDTDKLQAYDGGVVLSFGSITSSLALRYFSLTGVEQTSLNNTVTLQSGESYSDWTVDHTGVVSVLNTHDGTYCSEVDPANRLVRVPLNSTAQSISLASHCFSAEYRLSPSPSGGVVMMRRYGAQSEYDPTQKFLLVSNSGAISYGSIPLAHQVQVDEAQATYRVDGAGNIIFARNVQQMDGEGDRYVEVSVLKSSGTMKARYTTEPMEVNGFTDDYRLTSIGIGLVDGAMYVPICESGSSCYEGNPARLYRFGLSEVGLEYPRNVLLDIAPPSTTELNYVALGDSYASGEGVEPFFSSTDILQAASPSNANECHRSRKAYPEILGQDPELTVNLVESVACSGAITHNITTTGQWGEARQKDSLDSDVDAVTVMIGGNNAGFAKFVTQCLFADCSLSSVKQPFFDDIAGLGIELATTYSQILTEASNADVYVVGYPQALPDAACTQTDGWMGWINDRVGEANTAYADPENATSTQIASLALVRAIGSGAGLTTTQVNALISAGAVEFSSTEVATARSFVTALNTKISDTVGTSNSRLHFVSASASGSPFIGHELCTEDSYFHGLVPRVTDWGTSMVYSYHPNAKGQAAYASLMKPVLS